MSKLYTYIVVLFTFSLAAQSKKEIREAIKNRDRYVFAVKAENSNFVETVPFTEKGNVIIIQVKVKGEKYNFMFDTGATTIISPYLKGKLGLSPVMTEKSVDASGKEMKQEFYSLDTLTIGAVNFNTVGVLSFDLTDLSDAMCMKIDGVIGSNVMRVCNWKINYTDQALTFSDRSIKPGTDTKEVSFEENFTGNPVVKIHFRKFNFPIALDTGNNTGFNIPDSIYFKIIKPGTAAIKKGVGNNEYTFFQHKTNTIYEAIADSIYMDDVLLARQSIRITPTPSPLLGNRFLKKFGTIIIDYAHHTIVLPAVPVEADSFETYGLDPVFSDGKVMVGFVWEDSKAESLGISPGDVITVIDGKDTRNLTTEDWCSLRASLAGQTVMNLTILKKDTTEVKETFTRYDLLK